ncbi:MAG: short-chain fatty acyl-CoA regulator family protein [Rhizobiaceae bacterium]
MAETKIFVGPRVRRIRNRLELTQTSMAAELGISPSYLNLIERNQRPLTAQLVMKLVSTFKIDVDELQPTGEAGSVAALKEVFSDPLLSGELPGDTELLEISDGAPNAAIGIVKLYRAYREQQDRLSDLSQLMGQAGQGGEGGEGGQAGQISQAGSKQLPVDLVRSLFETVPWCFPALERAALRIRDALGDHQGTMAALYNLLRADHGIAVQVLPVETMPVWRKRFDRHSHRLFLSERLPRSQRAELLAQELVMLREGALLDEEVELLKVKGDEAVRLARFELARYAALSILMPYDRFQRVAERLQYDMIALASRFEVSFGQVAQRLVSLQDKSGDKRPGLPFFMMEVDQAGNVIRRMGAKGFPASSFGGNCPKLAAHAAFALPDQIIAERVINPQGDVYVTLSSTVEGPAVGPGERTKRSAILLGIEDHHATALVRAKAQEKPKRGAVVVETSDHHARAIVHAQLLPDVQAQAPVAIGPSCRLCEREDCIARSAPPLTRPLGLDELVQGFGAYGLT